MFFGRVRPGAQINIGAVDSPGAFINFMKGYQSQTFPAGTSPADLDADGYPITTLAGNIGGSIAFPSGFAGNGVNWKIKNTGTKKLKFVINTAVTRSASSGLVSTSGGAGGAMTVTFTGVGEVTFAFNNFAASTVSFFFSSGFANVAGTGELILVRASDETAHTGGAIFTPEFLALLADLNPTTIRPMGWVNTGAGNLTNEVQWRYRTTPTCLSWLNRQFRPNIWGGTVSGTDVYTMSAATDTPGSWTDGEVIQGTITNAATRVTISGAANNGSGLVRLTVSSTATLTTGQVVWVSGVAGTTEANGFPTITVIDATHIDLQGVSFVHAYSSTSNQVVATQTLDVGGRGAKWIASAYGRALFNEGSTDGPNAANTLATFIYDGLLDKVIYTGSGITPSVPLEARVSLANSVSANLWDNLPTMADDTYVSTWAAYVRDNLNPRLTFYAEYSNEVWNFAFPQTQWSYQRGVKLGFPETNNEPYFGWYGLRFRQVMGSVTTVWSRSRTSDSLKRVNAVQAFGNSGLTNTYRLQGSDLASTANGGNGNATWTSWTGGANYRSAPNRPIDYCDVLAYATYFSGANYNSGATYTAASAVFLQSLADNYNSGVAAQIATALADLDNDIRAGTKSAVLGTQTLLGLSNVIYPAWETIAAGYTGKTVEPYEGGLECDPPSAAECTTVGISIGGSAATASTVLTNLLEAYKNSDYGKNIVIDQFTQFLGQSHSFNPSWLTITGPNAWSLLPGNLFSTPYQTYTGFKTFRTGY